MAAAEQPAVKVKARVSFSAPGWMCERGDEIDVSIPDARRMCARGLAAPVDPEEPALKKMTRDEIQESRKIDHETTPSEVLRTRLGLQPPPPKQR